MGNFQEQTTYIPKSRFFLNNKIASKGVQVKIKTKW